jgi:argininosuccinate lyase
LGFKKIISNTIDATSSRDFMIEFMSDITSIMITQSRIAQDIIIWSSQEFSFVEISDKHASSSSAMPQKKNPDPLELTRSKTAIVIGNLTSITTILKSLPSGYTRDLQDTKIPFWNSIDITKLSLEIMRDIIDSLTIKKDKMVKASNNSYSISIDIAEALVMKERLPFRTAHRLVGSLVNNAFKKQISLKSLGVTDIKEIVQDMKISIEADKLIRIITDTDSQRSLSIRRSLGSPNPREQIKSIRKYRMLLRKYVNDLQKMKRELASTEETITKTISHIIKSKSKSRPKHM